VLAKRVRGDNPPEGASRVRQRRTRPRSGREVIIPRREQKLSAVGGRDIVPEKAPALKPNCFAERSRVRVDCSLLRTIATLVVIQPTIFALCQGESGSGASLDTCDRIGARWPLSVLSDDRPLKTDNRFRRSIDCLTGRVFDVCQNTARAPLQSSVECSEACV